ncbi:hypothetical protein BDW62DRAFT_174277 [Aspergillus aurantiobrunneus]
MAFGSSCSMHRLGNRRVMLLLLCLSFSCSSWRRYPKRNQVQTIATLLRYTSALYALPKGFYTQIPIRWMTRDCRD